MAYLSTNAAESVVAVWFHNVAIDIGIGPDPRIERAILDSITFRPGATDSSVLGRCAPPDPNPPTMPTPSRLTAPMALEGGGGQMLPEPPDVQPKVSAASVWTNLFHDFGNGGFSGPLNWNIYFGSYSAQTPATINPDGSTTPQYQGVPTWLIQGQGVETTYGPCGITVLAPYSADTGHPMGVVTTG
ncbi:MAG TPA: hypothetical protein VFP54_10410 [Acidimicrobiales bacterium]|nr:hypothetical protein [Acidimicrobiales bacterium]